MTSVDLVSHICDVVKDTANQTNCAHNVRCESSRLQVTVHFKDVKGFIEMCQKLHTYVCGGIDKSDNSSQSLSEGSDIDFPLLLIQLR